MVLFANINKRVIFKGGLTPMKTIFLIIRYNMFSGSFSTAMPPFRDIKRRFKHFHIAFWQSGNF